MPPRGGRRRPGRSVERGLRLDLRCRCGSTLRGDLFVPLRLIIEIRDLFTSFHVSPTCVVTDASVDVERG